MFLINGIIEDREVIMINSQGERSLSKVEGSYLQGVLNDYSEPDYQSLSMLLPQAKAVAELFSNSVIKSSANTPVLSIMPIGDLEPLNLELQHWSTSLFCSHNPNNPETFDCKTNLHRSSLRLPLSFLLGHLDTIIKFGQEVTSQSPRSELSWRAFLRKLSLEFSGIQFGTEQQLQNLSEMLLLD
jgi:hypothetical protein